MNKNFGDAKAPPYSSLNTGREVSFVCYSQTEYLKQAKNCVLSGTDRQRAVNSFINLDIQIHKDPMQYQVVYHML